MVAHVVAEDAKSMTMRWQTPILTGVDEAEVPLRVPSEPSVAPSKSMNTMMRMKMTMLKTAMMKDLSR